MGVLLETARALSTAGAPRNTVMILLTDAEEVGLLGAEAFVRERAEALGTTVVLNHEARGAGGAPLTFRMSSPNSELLEVLAGAPGAFADSSSEASFECPSLLIEYDNTQDRANHIHSVWRDLRRDFAGDLLAQHYAGVRH